MALLAEHGIPLEGARAVVVGRSAIVGKPTAHLLLQANATVTICHSRTQDIARLTLDADVLVVAVGRAGVVRAEMVKPGSAVVDVGMNRTAAGLVGDVDPGAASVAGFLHAGARGCRPDDDRLPAPECGALRASPPRVTRFRRPREGATRR